MIKGNYITLAIAAILFCGFSACTQTGAKNETNTDATEQVEGANTEDDSIKMEAASETETPSASSAEGDGKVHKINTATFIAEIFDYKANPQTWVYKGDKPAIIDFYADWCGPCKRVAPIMDELAIKYKGKVNFYKINTDEEQELSGSVFGIQSIPSILYIPLKGQPSMSAGAYPKEEYISQIESTLLK
jgi:thioredoxin